jgi:endonuclease III
VVAKLLDQHYGSPNHDNKPDPLDELIFIILSQMTTHQSFGRVYDRLRARFATWDQVLSVPISRLRLLINDAGLSRQKAPRIRAIIARVIDDFGAPTLLPLATMPSGQAELYLCTLPGVGVKTAKCVLMYSLRRRVLPVDTHVWRVAKRLGLLRADARYDDVHDELERVVPPVARYSLHVNSLVLGRLVCTAKRPRCEACPIRLLCAMGTTGASVEIAHMRRLPIAQDRR